MHHEVLAEVAGTRAHSADEPRVAVHGNGVRRGAGWPVLADVVFDASAGGQHVIWAVGVGRAKHQHQQPRQHNGDGLYGHCVCPRRVWCSCEQPGAAALVLKCTIARVGRAVLDSTWYVDSKIALSIIMWTRVDKLRNARAANTCH